MGKNEQVKEHAIFLIEIRDLEEDCSRFTTLQGLEAAEEFVKEFNERFKGEQVAKIFKN